MRLVPLITRGAPGATRPAGIPSLVTGRLNNGSIWSEDFFNVSVGTATAAGHPQWIQTDTAGTGSASCAPGSNGALRATSGALANNCTMIDAGSVNSTSFNYNLTVSGATTPFLLAARFSISGTANAITSARHGIGWVGYSSGGVTPVPIGTNWISDPDTTLLGSTAGSNSIVITRDSATYSGDTAGALMLRFYEATDTDSTSYELVAAPTAGTNYKVELYYNGAGSLLVYLNGALATTIACPSVSGWALRPSFGAMALGASARSTSVDWLYSEVALTSAR